MIGVSADSGAVRSMTSMRPDEMAAMKSASVDIAANDGPPLRVVETGVDPVTFRFSGGRSAD